MRRGGRAANDNRPAARIPTPTATNAPMPIHTGAMLLKAPDCQSAKQMPTTIANQVHVDALRAASTTMAAATPRRSRQPTSFMPGPKAPWPSRTRAPLRR